MEMHNVTINNIHSWTGDFSTELFTDPANVHYTEAGYEKIAVQVTKMITEALDR